MQLEFGSKGLHVYAILQAFLRPVTLPKSKELLRENVSVQIAIRFLPVCSIFKTFKRRFAHLQQNHPHLIYSQQSVSIWAVGITAATYKRIVEIPFRVARNTILYRRITSAFPFVTVEESLVNDFNRPLLGHFNKLTMTSTLNPPVVLFHYP